jgi:hypothetical protein
VTPANHTQTGGVGWLVMKSDGTPAGEDDINKASGMTKCAAPDCNLMVPPGADDCPDGHTQSDFTKGAPVDEKERADKAEAELAKAAERIAELEKAATVAPSTETAPAPEADISKSLETLPADVRQVIEAQIAKAADAEKKAQDAIEKADKLVEAGVSAEWIAKAADLVGAEVAPKFGPILRTIDAVLGAESRGELERVLKGAREIAKASDLFKAQGQAGTAGGGSALEELQAKADELRKADTSMTREAAVAKAAELDPALRARVQSEQRSAAARS